MIKNQEDIVKRLENVFYYYQANWAERELAAPTASELIWVLTGEEGLGESYLDGLYLLPNEFKGLNG